MPTEEEVREDIGLSKKPRKQSEPGFTEQIIREELQHPTPPAEPEPENISVNRFLELHPQMSWVVDDHRSKGENDEQIESILPYFVKTIPHNIETQVRQDLGVPKPKKQEPWPLENQVRKKLHLERRGE